jgi:hypothetical protein
MVNHTCTAVLATAVTLAALAIGIGSAAPILGRGVSNMASASGNFPIGVLPQNSRHRRGNPGLLSGGDPTLWVGGGKIVPWTLPAADFYVYAEFKGNNRWGSENALVEKNINWAVDHLQQRTGLSFVPYDASQHSAYVVFGNFAPNYCSAPAPSKTGYTFVNLGWCRDTGSILHELLHVLGVSHTQSRFDRETYVDVDQWALDNGNYNLQEEDHTQGLPYDFTSQMHYGLSSHMTLTTVGAHRLAEQGILAHQIGLGDGNKPNAGLSPLDSELINRMYFDSSTIVGSFVIDGYDGNKNDWHYVTITEKKQAAVVSTLQCVGDRSTYDAGFGGCSTYTVGANGDWCEHDVDSNGHVAEDVCSECGKCSSATTATTATESDTATTAKIFTWTNKAGVAWTLTQKKLSPAQFDVSADCPFYSHGYTVATAKLDENGEVLALTGPWGEIYDKMGAPAIGYDTLADTFELYGKGCSSPGVTCVQKPMPRDECMAICDGEETCKAFQEPADNGFHHYCVFFDYTPEQAEIESPSCPGTGNFVYIKQHGYVAPH